VYRLLHNEQKKGQQVEEAAVVVVGVLVEDKFQKNYSKRMNELRR